MFKDQPIISNAKVLVLVSNIGDLSSLCNFLKEHFKEVKIVTVKETVSKFAQSEILPDIILIGTSTQKKGVFEFFEHLKGNSSAVDVPVFLIIEGDEPIDEDYGHQLGVADYITKPISLAIVLARIKTHLELKLLKAGLLDQKTIPEGQAQEQRNDPMLTQYAAIYAMGYLAETRENVTGNHIFRNQHYVKVLAEKLRVHPRFSSFLDDGIIEFLYMTAPLHDIGNVGIPDRILLKPGRLTPDEFEIIKSHTQLGRDVILKAERDLGIEVPILKFARQVIYSHHEKWDGTGYPEGLAGDAIPIPARIAAIADVYDALISRRVYKSPVSHEQAVKTILEGKGKHFDPDIVDAFCEIHEEFQRIAQNFADSDKDFKKKIDYMEQAISINP